MIYLSDNISNYIKKYFGEEYFAKYKEYYNSSYKSYIRFSHRIDSFQLIKNLKEYGIELKKIDTLNNVYKVMKGEELIGKTIYYILGYYYIQSLSSMIPALLLNPNKNDRVLDLCAAPGSKTTLLSELMNNKGTLIANEISLERMRILMFNIDKMNLLNVGVINRKGELLSKSFDNYFDKILVDAPCSALGIVQKKGEVSNWWNENKVTGISEIQLRLLISAIKMLKVGGEVVYSTCTLTLEENELVLNKVLKKYPVELVDIKLPVKSRAAFTKYKNEELNSSISKAHRILPWEIESEGFFIAKLRKIEKTEPTLKSTQTEKKVLLLNSFSSKIKNLLIELSNYYGIDFSIFNSYKYLMRSKDVYFIDKEWECDELNIFNRIGSKFGSIDKRGQIQFHTLAAQILGQYANQNIVELKDNNELEIYINGGTIKKDYKDKGQKIVKYNDYILGTAAVSNEGLKSQFPRALRTQEIVIKQQ